MRTTVYLLLGIATILIILIGLRKLLVALAGETATPESSSRWHRRERWALRGVLGIIMVLFGIMIHQHLQDTVPPPALDYQPAQLKDGKIIQGELR